MTNEEAKKAGFRTASGALYVYWCIENGHIYVRSCDTCALTGSDFPTRAKAREELRKRKLDAEHAKWLADMQSQTTPITPEQAKDLRIRDRYFVGIDIAADALHFGDDGVDKSYINKGLAYWTREAAEAALAKQAPCADLIDADDDVYEFDGHRNEYFGKVHSVCPQMVGVPRETCGKDIRSTKNRLRGSKRKSVESHETPVGETQGKEVVTDETQDTEPVKWTDFDTSDTIDCNTITLEWYAWKARQDAKASNKELVVPVDVTSTNDSESEKLSNKPNAVSHPSHYISHPSGVECITITKHMNFCRGNAVKYLWRAGQKGDSLDKEIEDIAKAEEYCRIEKERLIATKGAK